MNAMDDEAHYEAIECPECEGPTEPNGPLRVCRWCFHTFTP